MTVTFTVPEISPMSVSVQEAATWTVSVPVLVGVTEKLHEGIPLQAGMVNQDVFNPAPVAW